MIETEKKFRLTKEEFDTIREKLINSKIHFSSKVKESNVIYKQKRGGTVLRVRHNVSKTEKPEYILTYKGEAVITPDGMKSRTEIETPTGSEIYDILRELGHKQKIVYEKYRETFYPADKGHAIFCLDELPFGYYLEIEGDADAIHFAEKFLDMDLDLEIYSYPTLTKIYGKLEDGLIVAKFTEQDRRVAADLC